MSAIQSLEPIEEPTVWAMMTVEQRVETILLTGASWVCADCGSPEAMAAWACPKCRSNRLRKVEL